MSKSHSTTLTYSTQIKMPSGKWKTISRNVGIRRARNSLKSTSVAYKGFYCRLIKRDGMPVAYQYRAETIAE